MKKITRLVLFVGAAYTVAACSHNNNTFNFPVLNDEQFECTYGHKPTSADHHDNHHSAIHFGNKISESGAMTSADLVKHMTDKDSANVKFSAVIHQVCQKKGCWMDVELSEGNTMTVTFKDYAFFVPKDASGKTAVMDGIARKEIETVAWLKEKAKDEGKSKDEIAAIKDPVSKLTFEASGVIIK